MGYVIRDGLIYITHPESATEVVIYNCRGLGKPRQPHEIGPSDYLVDVITRTIAPQTWNEVGGAGSIQELNGLLIVDQSQEVHRQLERFLDMLRVEVLKP